MRVSSSILSKSIEVFLTESSFGSAYRQLDRWQSQEHDLLLDGSILRSGHYWVSYYLERKLARARFALIWVHPDTCLWCTICMSITSVDEVLDMNFPADDISDNAAESGSS